jgi:hypothetical protein
VEKSFKAAQKEGAEKAGKERKVIEPSDTVINEGRRSGALLRVQTKFAKDIKEMMEGHSEKVLMMYRHSLERKRRQLLKEKLRRLLLAQKMAQQKSKNLFE